MPGIECSCGKHLTSSRAGSRPPCYSPRVIPLDAWHARGGRFLHRGHPIFFVDEGSGPALLLVHGFPTASWDWTPVWAGLSARFRVIAPDLIGFGFSAKPRSY